VVVVALKAVIFIVVKPELDAVAERMLKAL
jgi:hypothetical protein